MPLPNYGVAIGTLVRFYRDPVDSYGRWYHGHVEVSTPTGIWTSALDVDTPNGLGVRFRTSGSLSVVVLGPVGSLAPGFYPVISSPLSGAVDYFRSGFLADRLIFLSRRATLGLPRSLQMLPPPLPEGLPPIPQRETTIPDSIYEALLSLLHRIRDRLPERVGFRIRPWQLSNGDNALAALEAELVANRKVYLFGNRFTSGQGVHDVHQNQGDPLGSQWAAQNGIWQDGAVAVERSNGTIFFWQVKFDSQASKTDNAGHPA